MDEIEKNIRKTIRDMKRKGTIGASIDCLRQNTPMAGMVLEIPRGVSLAEAYRTAFELAARKVAADMGFDLCDY